MRAIIGSLMMGAFTFFMAGVFKTMDARERTDRYWKDLQLTTLREWSLKA